MQWVRILPVFILACWRRASGLLANVFHYVPALHSLRHCLSRAKCLPARNVQMPKKREKKISSALLLLWTWSFTAFTNLFLMVALRPLHSSQRHSGDPAPPPKLRILDSGAFQTLLIDSEPRKTFPFFWITQFAPRNPRGAIWGCPFREQWPLSSRRTVPFGKQI